MRDYGCTYKQYVKDGRFLRNGNGVCWAGINNMYFVIDGDYWPKTEIGSMKYIPFKERSEFLKDDYIYIEKYKQPEISWTEIRKLCKIINEITPCILDYKKRWIKYKLLPQSYNHNLILLNFIRNCWHESSGGLARIFFDNLDSDLEDPLAKLTYANKIVSEKFNSAFSPGHSNINPGAKVKNLTEFLNTEINSTRGFLIS